MQENFNFCSLTWHFPFFRLCFRAILTQPQERTRDRAAGEAANDLLHQTIAMKEPSGEANSMSSKVVEWVITTYHLEEVGFDVHLSQLQLGPAQLSELHQILCGDPKYPPERQTPRVRGPHRKTGKLPVEEVEARLDKFKNNLYPLALCGGHPVCAAESITPSDVDDLVENHLLKHYDLEKQAKVVKLAASVLLGRYLTEAKRLLTRSGAKKKLKDWLIHLQLDIKISLRTARNKMNLWKHYGKYPRLWLVREKQLEFIKLGPQISKYLETHPQEALFWGTSPSLASSTTNSAPQLNAHPHDRFEVWYCGRGGSLCGDGEQEPLDPFFSGLFCTSHLAAMAGAFSGL